MTPGNIDTLITVIGVIAFLSLGLGGLKIIVGAWVKRKELAAGGDADKFLEAIEAVRSEQDELRNQLNGEIADLQERVDFAERLLTKGQYDPRHGEMEH
ncbi:MAG: hypothetical protein JSW71_15305 [Gemmatimonadota bacterium]|nr:MAG: hypothetical protein JSW71_15305 [Gemmatimonadota bacterium]